MLFSPHDRLFDTLVDTKKIYVSMQTSFKLRSYTNSDGTSPVYLHITGDRKRERINLKINVIAKNWDAKKQKVNPKTPDSEDINLLLDSVKAKITGIKTVYRLSERILTPEILRKELNDGMSRVLFCSFFKQALEEQKPQLSPGTFEKNLSVLNKLREYNEDLMFSQIDYAWFENFRNHFLKKGNKKTTVNTNIGVIKKFLKIAVKSGIKIRVVLDDIEVGSTNGNRTCLSTSELKKAANFFFSEFINPSHRLILGYFLFSCMTGLRISDIQKLDREGIYEDYISIIAKKTSKDQTISLNMNARKILNHEPLLFVKKISDQQINRELKKIMTFLGITKKVTFHVSRHTFATSFLRAGGAVEKLQKLLNHSSIKETMIYVHIQAAEANEQIFLLDNLL